MTRSFRFSLYSVLRVSVTASSAEIKAAFRSLALKHHPDKNQNSPESTARFKTIHNAYAILSNQESRTEYDRVLGVRRASEPDSAVNASEASIPRGNQLAGPQETLSLLLDHLNFVLWDIEDLMFEKKKAAGSARGNATNQCLLMMLTFIDRWVLQAAGFRDYFFQARGLNSSARFGGTSTVPYQDLRMGHRPYVDPADYFYTVRRRLDEFFRRAKIIDLSLPISGTSITLADCILEAHNYCVYYLGWLKGEEEREGGKIPMFPHSSSAFHQED